MKLLYKVFILQPFKLFVALSSESTPIQIVDFLNDLWSVFDDIIAKYNVYKVNVICFVMKQLLF